MGRRELPACPLESSLALTFVAHAANRDPDTRFVMERLAGDYLAAEPPPRRERTGRGAGPLGQPWRETCDPTRAPEANAASDPRDGTPDKCRPNGHCPFGRAAVSARNRAGDPPTAA